MANAAHTCNCACYSWAISIHFYSLHVGKRHVLQLIHCALVACKNKALCSLLSRHLSCSNFVYLSECTSGPSRLVFVVACSMGKYAHIFHISLNIVIMAPFQNLTLISRKHAYIVVYLCQGKAI